MATNPDRTDAGSSHEEREWLRVTLSCIGDAVITTDATGNVTLLNPVAESLTGWAQQEAHGVPLGIVFNALDEETRKPVESPTVRAVREGVVVQLSDHTLLVARDGSERAIDQSATPIRNAAGDVTGVVVVFRDVTPRRQQEKRVQDALDYANNIMATLREPFAVLDKDFRVRTANAAFYETFHVSKNQTEKYSLFVLGNGQWDNPRLRKLLGEILSAGHAVEHFEVEHDFPTIGRKVMLLNARRIVVHDGGTDLILLAIEDVTERRRVEEKLRRAKAAVQAALAYADNIITTLREPFVVLDRSLRVQKANPSFYRAFSVSKTETENHTLFELGNGQWDIPRLRTMLVEVLSVHHAIEDFEVDHDFPTIGRKVMLLNARRIVSLDGGSDLILLAIEDVTELRLVEENRRRDEIAWRKSEVQYRRLFESARDGILILDEKSGRIIDANPYMSEILGYKHSHFLGKELWEIGFFKDIASNRTAFRELQLKGFIRYDHLPLETQDKRKVEVEFVSNSYDVEGQALIQCDIRDCSERFRLEREILVSLEEKDVLLKEVHHRVKNNLQVISSLLHLQSQHTQDRASVQMFRESQNRVRSMALVHERLYRSKDLSQVDFTDYIESLATHLFSSHQVDTDRIGLAVDVHGVKLPIDSAVPCGLLLNELISNCLKHAFRGRERGEIRIVLQPLNDSELLLSVGDDGVGLPPNIEPQSGETFGMQLIADLVDQVHGSVQVNRDAGTTVRIVFPTDEARVALREDRT